MNRGPNAASGIVLTELFDVRDERKIRIASQIGIRHAIGAVLPALSHVPRERYLPTLQKVKEDFNAYNMVLSGVESHPVPAEKIKLGLPGRDEEIDNYIAAIEALSKIGVTMVCYNWMAGLGWYRTKFDTPTRGGALVSEFNDETAREQGLTEWGEITEQELWNNLEYFLRAIIPVAAQFGVKMALHPDDPPLSPLRGIARIVTSAANYRRILNFIPSSSNGITFCQANFLLMGEDVASLVREWSSQGKIFYVHLRDIEGTRVEFRETFHDNGPTDLAQMLRVYHESGFTGPLRPDHAPTLEGESNENPGYAMGGKVFAVGYIKGIMDALGIPYL